MVWLPQVEVFVRCIAKGSWPLWDPDTGFGRPLLADPRAEVAYPLTWLNLVMPPGAFYTLLVVVHLAASGWGQFLLARRWRVSTLGAFVAGAVWIASGPLLSLAPMWHHLAGAAWIPWLFLAADVALESDRISRALVWGGILAAQVFAGSPDYTALTLPCLVLYVLLRRPSWRAGGSAARSPLLVAALALLFGLALSAIQWLPTLDWVLRSARRAQPYWERTTWSLHPASLFELIAPMSWASLPLTPSLQATLLDSREPWLHSIFLGVAALSLVAAGCLSRLPRKAFLVTVVLGAVLFSLGRHSPAHDVAGFLLPPLRMLRFPVKAMVLGAFAWSMLAGFGVEVWRRSRAVGRRAWAFTVVAPAVLALILSLLAMTATASGSESWAARLLAVPTAHAAPLLAAAATRFAWTAALSCLVLLLAFLRPGRWAALILAGLAVGSLAVVHKDLHPIGHRELFRVRPPVLERLEHTGFPRLYVYDYGYSAPDVAPLAGGRRMAEAYRVARIPAGWDAGEALVLATQLYLHPPTAARWGVAGSFDRDILGFEPPPHARLNELLRKAEGTPAHAKLLRIGGVHDVLALLPEPWWGDLVPSGSVDGLLERPIQILRVPDPLPRTYVVNGVRVAEAEQALSALADPGFDPTREVLLPSGTSRAPAPSSPGTARITEMRPDRVRLEAELAAAGHLVLLDGYDPGWSATVDGRPVPVLRANVVFRAVALPAGRQTVEFVYRPRAAIAGAALTLFASFVAIACGARGLRRSNSP